MRTSWDEYWMDIARAAATRSTCLRLHVGAVIEKNNVIISTGYNGSKSGDVHCEDVGCDLVDGRCIRTIHAEDNAIRHSSWRKRCGGTLYTTDEPCEACAQKIIKSGISEVVFDRAYHAAPGLVPYHEAGIVIRSIGQ